MLEQSEMEGPEVEVEALQIAAFIKLTKAITNLEKLVKSTIEKGIVEPTGPLTIRTAQRVVRPPYAEKPWFGVTITNDGPESVWLIVNTEKSLEKDQELKKDETYEVDFKTAVIKDVVLWTLTGTATVRIRGTR